MDSVDPPPALPSDAEDTDTRSNHRESLFIGVDIGRSDSRSSGRIRNISATGAYIESDAGIALGERLTLSFRGVSEIGATVMRTSIKGVGVRFDREIDPAVCRQSVIGGGGAHPNWAPPPSIPIFRPPSAPARPRR